MYKKIDKKNTGFSLIEVLIASAIISLCMVALVSAGTEGLKLSKNALRQTQAGLILEEGAEAVKSIRDQAWTNISSLNAGTTYYLYFNTSSNIWTLTTTPQSTIDNIFTRTVMFTNVTRDANYDIVTNGGILDDPRSKQVMVNVTWAQSNGVTSSKSLNFYLVDIFT